VSLWWHWLIHGSLGRFLTATELHLHVLIALKQPLHLMISCELLLHPARLHPFQEASHFQALFLRKTVFQRCNFCVSFGFPKSALFLFHLNQLCLQLLCLKIFLLLCERVLNLSKIKELGTPFNFSWLCLCLQLFHICFLVCSVPHL